MLLFSLAISIVGLIAINLCMQAERRKTAAVLSVGMMFGCVGSMVLLIQGFFTLPLIGVVDQPVRKRFAVVSVIIMLFAYAIPFKMAWNEDQQMAVLREKYPFMSLEERLPVLPNREQDPAFSEQSLASIESGLGPNDNWSLKHIHDSRLHLFINAPGFGNMRGGGFSEWRLRERQNSEAILHQPVMPQPDSEPGTALSSLSAEIGLNTLHRNGVLDFVYVAGFGYTLNGKVAGFRSHRFSKIPAEKIEWTVDSIELTGVLVSDTPRVYVSKHLPRMDELSKTNTRPVDTFEADGLAALKSGDELYVRTTGEHARMMGAIRNANQCRECHGGQRGELLGAFSYRLRQAE